MSRIENMYFSLPVPLQNLAITGYGAILLRRRYGLQFWRELPNVKMRERFSVEEWNQYSLKELNKVLAIAQNVPYYKANRYPDRVASLSELARIPLLNKEELRQSPENFLVGGKRKWIWNLYHTSGTTGIPLSLYRDHNLDQRFYAYHEQRVRRLGSVSLFNHRAMFGGCFIVPRKKLSQSFMDVHTLLSSMKKTGSSG